MKRLLAYLFIVLGLGLVFSVNAKAGIKIIGTKIDLSFCKKKSVNYNILYPVLTKNLANHCTWEGGVQITYQEYLRDPGPFAKKNICFNTRTKLVNSRNSTCPKDLGHSKVFYENGKFYYKDTKTQIAKAESSQTQEVTKNKIQTKKFNVIYNAYSMKVNILNLGYTTVLFLDNGKCKASTNLGGIFRNYKYEGDQQVKCKWQYADDKNHIVNINFGYGIKNIITENAILRKDLNGEIYAFAQSRSLKVVKEDPNNIIRLAKKYDVSEFLSLINKKQKTQIAKKETKKKIVKKKIEKEKKIAREKKNGYYKDHKYKAFDDELVPYSSGYYKDDCLKHGHYRIINTKTNKIKMDFYGIFENCKIFDSHSKFASSGYDDEGNLITRSVYKRDVSHIYGEVPFLGIGLGEDKDKNVIIIQQIYDESPASKSNLKKGYLILKANNFPLKKSQELVKIIQEVKIGDEIKIEYVEKKLGDNPDYKTEDIKTTFIKPELKKKAAKLIIQFTPKGVNKSPGYYEFIRTYQKSSSIVGKQHSGSDFLDFKILSTPEYQERLKKEFDKLHAYYSSFKSLQSEKAPKFDYSNYYVLSNKNILKEKIKEKKKQEEKIVSASSGTGFFISKEGHIISNNHVVDACHSVKIHHKGKIEMANIISRDRTNDLALLQTNIQPNEIFSISNIDAALLEDVYVAGYPFGKSVSSSIKVTKGVVSGLSGFGDNYANLQIDAALQPGNSGGPIIDEFGNVVGVAVSKLDFKEALKAFGTIPENTNFGVKSSVVKSFTNANLINLKEINNKKISKKAIGKKILDGTVYVDCWMTASKIEEMKTRKTLFPNLELN